MTPTLYRIQANLLCHDVRLNTSIETQVAFDHLPSAAEVLPLLYPIADERVPRALCEGCPYDLTIISIQPIGPAAAERGS